MWWGDVKYWEGKYEKSKNVGWEGRVGEGRGGEGIRWITVSYNLGQRGCTPNPSTGAKSHGTPAVLRKRIRKERKKERKKEKRREKGGKISKNKQKEIKYRRLVYLVSFAEIAPAAWANSVLNVAAIPKFCRKDIKTDTRRRKKGRGRTEEERN